MFKGQRKLQRRSQAVSPLPPFVVGRNTMVAAGHVTTQNLGQGVVKKSVGREGRGGRVFWLLLWRTLWVSKHQPAAKNYPLYLGSKSNLCRWRMLHYFCRLAIIAETLRQLAHVKRRVPNRSETSGSVPWIFEFGGNLFSSLCGILDV